MHVCKRTHNVHVKIYGTHKMHVLVTYCVKKPFLNFVWFLDFSILCVYCSFYLNLFLQIQKYCPLKCVWRVQGYSIFFIESASVSDGKNPSLYHHLCFVVIHQSNQVSLILRWNSTHSSHKNCKICMINPFEIDKRAANDNPISKSETTIKMSLELTSRIKLGRQGANAPNSRS